MTPEQCCQARKLLGWHQQRLALQVNSCVSTIVGFETRQKHTREAVVSAIHTALETAGVEFIAEDGGGVGVRLRKQHDEEGATE
jgi:ribosome-binding protein aMBF1 (putative translation factor)